MKRIFIYLTLLFPAVLFAQDWKIFYHPDISFTANNRPTGLITSKKGKGAFNDFEEESRTQLKWNGVDAFEVTYSGNMKSGDPVAVCITQRLCFHKPSLYLLTYTTLKNRDAYAVTARQIMNAVKFKA